MDQIIASNKFWGMPVRVVMSYHWGFTPKNNTLPEIKHHQTPGLRHNPRA
jgi:hypothetical protein